MKTFPLFGFQFATSGDRQDALENHERFREYMEWRKKGAYVYGPAMDDPHDREQFEAFLHGEFDAGTPKRDLAEAMDLLRQAAGCMAENETSPNNEWCKRFFLLDGSHMILTDEGWDHGAHKAQYEKDGAEILDEVNAP